MLNELLIVERAARAAGIALQVDHPDVKDCGEMPTLVVRLDEDGGVAEVRPLPAEVRAWTMRNGQKNGFPFVKGLPLALNPSGEVRTALEGNRKRDRRAALLQLAAAAGRSPVAHERRRDWPPKGLLGRLGERREDLAGLAGTEAEVVLDTVDRFLLACETTEGQQALVCGVVRGLIGALEQVTDPDWVRVADALLWGKPNQKSRTWVSEGALLFEAHGTQVRIFAPPVRAAVSEAFNRGARADDAGLCALTGDRTPLLTGYFPQPNLPALGQTFLYARNTATPASARYARTAAAAMPVGAHTANSLAGALNALAAHERQGKTWCSVPGEVAGSDDLVLAFAEADLEAPVAGTLAEDYSEEEEELGGDPGSAQSIAAFEKRAERVIQAVRGRVSGDFRQTPVRVVWLRKVDRANRKVVHCGVTTVGGLYAAATEWAAGERNLPDWLTLPIAQRRGSAGKAGAARPPHIAPLGLVALSREAFIRAGSQPQRAVALPAGEALALFLDGARDPCTGAVQRARRVLRMVLARRHDLVVAAGAAQRRGPGARSSTGNPRTREALRTATMLGLLLRRLGRLKEGYMSDTAFKLGQLLAAADVVHAGYCADVRKGALPTSLLGNQVFAMAQSSPVKALAVLCRRWKPYDGWAKQAARKPERADDLVASTKATDQRRGWDIKIAVSQARRVGELAEQLASSLPECRPGDTYRAELLLGYLAGLPKAQGPHADEPTAITVDEAQEE